jgi:FkbM family methyltransferase
MDTLPVRVAGDLTMVVPATLQSISTYVLLEQETWFEKELGFVRRWLKPGMTAIDIGANLGAYSLALARAVGPQGRVFAYEPASATRALLSQSRDINALKNLEIVGAALADAPQTMRLVFGESSELHALGDSGPGEDVPVTTLDIEEAQRGWPSPDFIKIDAEGAEERIIAGGAAFFSNHSPLIMFEIKAGASINHNIAHAFSALGFRPYRLLDGDMILVPATDLLNLDSSELNLFAIKPDRAAQLGREDFLVEKSDAWVPHASAVDAALDDLRSQSFAASFKQNFASVPWNADYRNALAAFSVWRDRSAAPARRCGALEFAEKALTQVCAREPTVARLSTFARIAWEAGHRGASNQALARLLQMITTGAPPPNEPFWPASPRYDQVSPGSEPALWVLAAIIELSERTSSYSTAFGPSPRPEWLCRSPFVTAEMERRRVLQQALSGSAAEVPPILMKKSPDHLNAELWASGQIPGTIVRS